MAYCTRALRAFLFASIIAVLFLPQIPFATGGCYFNNSLSNGMYISGTCSGTYYVCQGQSPGNPLYAQYTCEECAGCYNSCLYCIYPNGPLPAYHYNCYANGGTAANPCPYASGYGGAGNPTYDTAECLISANNVRTNPQNCHAWDNYPDECNNRTIGKFWGSYGIGNCTYAYACVPANQHVDRPALQTCCAGSQYNSSSGYCGACILAGTGCNAGDTCCGSATCSGGKCCLASGQASCTSDSQCCGSLTCNTATHTCVVPCSGSVGGSCKQSTGNWCCSQTPALFCDYLNSQTNPVCKNCWAANDACNSTQSCCSQTPSLYCDPLNAPSTCKSCESSGQKCDSTYTCCSGAGTCDLLNGAGNQVCKACRTNGLKCDPSSSILGCCSGFCDNLNYPAYPQCRDCIGSNERCDVSDNHCCGSASICDELNYPSSPKCRSCIPTGDLCAKDSDCCHKACAGATSTTPGTCACIANGAACTVADDCCGGFCEQDGATRKCMSPYYFCNNDKYGDAVLLTAIGGIGMLALVALVYMAGEAFSNPRMLNWAKIEAAQVVFSLAIVLAIIGSLSLFTCGLQVGEMQQMFGFLPKIYAGHETEGIYQAAETYLGALQRVCIETMASIRYNLAAYELRTTFTEFECEGTCVYSMSSTNVAAFAGDSMYLAVTNSLLSTSTISYLSATFQFFTLKYIEAGFLFVFLPLAIVIRSVPFMRQFGGALIAIFVGMYLIYPVMIVVNAAIAPGLASFAGEIRLDARTADAQDCGGAALGVFSTSAGKQLLLCSPSTGAHTEQHVEGSRNLGSMSAMDPTPLGKDNFTMLVKLNVLIFLTAVFLPALGFIVVAAFVRGIARFLGEDVDISKLGQMV